MKKYVTLLSGCLLVGLTSGCQVQVHEPAVEVTPPSATVDVGAPVVVEEGAVYDGQVVAAVDPLSVDWVFVGGGWHYWNPTLNVWVHANRPAGWHPAHFTRLNSWADRPMEHRDAHGHVFREAARRPAARPKPAARRPEDRKDHPDER